MVVDGAETFLFGIQQSSISHVNAVKHSPVTSVLTARWRDEGDQFLSRCARDWHRGVVVIVAFSIELEPAEWRLVIHDGQLVMRFGARRLVHSKHPEHKLDG